MHALSLFWQAALVLPSGKLRGRRGTIMAMCESALRTTAVSGSRPIHVERAMEEKRATSVSSPFDQMTQQSDTDVGCGIKGARFSRSNSRATATHKVWDSVKVPSVFSLCHLGRTLTIFSATLFGVGACRCRCKTTLQTHFSSTLHWIHVVRHFPRRTWNSDAIQANTCIFPALFPFLHAYPLQTPTESHQLL